MLMSFKVYHRLIHMMRRAIYDRNVCQYLDFQGDVQRQQILYVSVWSRSLWHSARVGNSLSAILDGRARLLFLSRDEEYVITMPYAHCKGNGLGLHSMLTLQV